MKKHIISFIPGLFLACLPACQNQDKDYQVSMRPPEQTPAVEPAEKDLQAVPVQETSSKTDSTETKTVDDKPKGPPSDVPTLSELEEGKTHIVQKGDSFWSIAAKYYGNGKQWPLIQKANPNVDPRMLKVGQKLKIPPLPEK